MSEFWKAAPESLRAITGGVTVVAAIVALFLIANAAFDALPDGNGADKGKNIVAIVGAITTVVGTIVGAYVGGKVGSAAGAESAAQADTARRINAIQAEELLAQSTPAKAETAIERAEARIRKAGLRRAG